jgi:hypothetical protein
MVSMISCPDFVISLYFIIVVKRTSWLSVTPEPERELPEAVCTLAARGPAEGAAVAAEQRRVERLVLRGSQRQWLDYLHEVVDLISRAADSPDPRVRAARDRALAVVSNHHNLLLGLGGPGARLTQDDRARLEELTTAGPPTPTPLSLPGSTPKERSR